MKRRRRGRPELLRKYAWLLAALPVVALLATWVRADPSSRRTVRVPDPDISAETLATRKAAQEKTVRDFQVFHQFQFSDRQPESGISFVHHFTDDSGKFYKANHYDHGNGIAVADVDGDGLYDVYFVSQLGGNQLWKNLGNGKFQDITES